MANIESKKALVDEIKANIKNNKSIFFVDYKGITVDQDTTFRKKLRDNDAGYRVYKNRLIMRALDECGIKNYDAKLLEGATSVVFGADETTAAGILFKLGKEFSKGKSKAVLNTKFGILNGEVIDAAKAEMLSKIPSKEVLISQLLYVLNAPMSALARALDAIAKKI